MLKKIFITFVFILFVSSSFICTDTVSAKPDVQPLKLEQDSKKAYTYGNLEKEFTKSWHICVDVGIYNRGLFGDCSYFDATKTNVLGF